MKGKALRKHRLQEKTAASVLLKLFISSNKSCHTTDAPQRMSGTLFSNVNNMIHVSLRYERGAGLRHILYENAVTLISWLLILLFICLMFYLVFEILRHGSCALLNYHKISNCFSVYFHFSFKSIIYGPFCKALLISSVSINLTLKIEHNTASNIL